MPVKTSKIQVNDIIKMLHAGHNVSEISIKVGVKKHVVFRIAKKNGISTKRINISDSIDFNAVLELFNKGIGVGGIAKHLGVSESPIKTVFRRNGIATRNRSEQQQARMDNTSPEQIKYLTSKANAAMRGIKMAHNQLVKQAATRFKNQSASSSYLEETFDVLMRDKGYEGIRQFQIDKYNADFIFGDVVVEIFGGHWHWTGQHLAGSKKRIKTILDAGFHLIIIAARGNGISFETASKVVALIQEFGLNKTSVRHYRMIRSNGEDVITSTSNDDDLTIEWPFRNIRNPSAGRYHSIR